MLSVFLALHIHGFNEICNSEFAIMLGFYFLSIFIFTPVHKAFLKKYPWKPSIWHLARSTFTFQQTVIMYPYL